MSPAVSIVLPCYNRVEYLRAAVDSVMAQTFGDWDLVVGDDGSTGETAEYLAELETRPQIRVLRLPHSGVPSKVRNAASREARGTYIAYLDSDDVWMPTKLERQIALHRSCAKCRWSYVAMERIHADGTLMLGEPQRAIPSGAIFEHLLRLAADVSMSGIMAERTLLENLGFFDEALPFFEDFDLFMRLSLQSDVLVVAEPLVRMRSHAEHYSENRVSMLTGRAQLLDKMRPEADRLGLHEILCHEMRENDIDLARAYAYAGDSREALRTLWRTRAGALDQRRWWTACAAAAKSLAPEWTRAAYGRLRQRATSTS